MRNPSTSEAPEPVATPDIRAASAGGTGGHPFEKPFCEMLEVERETIETRREQSLPGSFRPGVEQWTGLSLSGGGVRSACFNLGLLEALDERELTPPCDDRGAFAPTTRWSSIPPRTPASGAATKPKFLEMFDYLSAVSGGSYIVGHLAMAMQPERAGESGKGNRFGDLHFTSNSVPRWFWALGVWFLGFTFQLLKTGSLLVMALGIIAFVLRMCDAPDVMRFCGIVGLDSDVKRGFVPFWASLGVLLITWVIQFWGGPALRWLAWFASLVVVYSVSVCVLGRSHTPGAVAFWFHCVFLAVVLVLTAAFLFLARWTWTRRPPNRSNLTPLSISTPIRWLSLLPGFVALLCLAGLFTTGDVGFAVPLGEGDAKAIQEASDRYSRWGDYGFKAAIAAIGTISLAFLRYRDLINSTRVVADQFTNTKMRPVYQVVVFLCSYGLLLLVLFVLYGLVAGEDVSGYNDRREADPAAAFHKTDYQDYDKAWEKIDTDARNRKKPVERPGSPPRGRPG